MKTFTPNTPFLTKKFNEFNATYFDGKLPMVHFTYGDTKSEYGRYNRATNTIRITRAVPQMTEHDCEEILIHEMVHAWQNYMGLSYWRDGHRGSFVRKAKEINSKSNGYFHIATYTSLENGSDSIQRNTDYVKLLVCSKNGDSTFYVGRVLDETRFEIWLGKHFDDIKCYVGSGKELGDFVKSIKRFNYVTMSEDRFNESVKPYIKSQIPFNNKYVAKKTA